MFKSLHPKQNELQALFWPFKTLYVLSLKNTFSSFCLLWGVLSNDKQQSFDLTLKKNCISMPIYVHIHQVLVFFKWNISKKNLNEPYTFFVIILIIYILSYRNHVSFFNDEILTYLRIFWRLFRRKKFYAYL